ncbi:hypothetical protein [Nonomuraea rhodomycinica]|uniref:Uncharacterized protein n=1 Tax=Nonomuraea rhodomycinica TaxID=1712872 RepID=A0A7Y6M8E1_9ACTN|nr:hypothetical protein [Nonomuraea rhodomycinica]NUW39018.1 hypothetical protein [Nonomuraea rhodomycinica]
MPSVRRPAPATVNVPMEPSPALRQAGGRPDGPAAPEITVPAGSRLVSEVEREASRLVGAKGPDVRSVLPDTKDARPLTLKSPPAALSRALADTLTGALGGGGGGAVGSGTGGAGSAAEATPGLTYRLCVESAEVPVSCSAVRPVAVPVAADVTGDGLPDLAADLVPAARPQEGAVGLAFAVRRLPGAPEKAGTAGKAGKLRARVWAEYDGRVSVGFDGLRKGASLSAADRGTFTVDLSGKQVRAEVRRTDPGASAAVIAGLTGRTAVSLTQTPATGRLTVDAALGTPALEVSASAPARVDAVAVDGGRYVRAVLDRMPTRARVELARRDGAARLRFSGSSPAGRAELRSYSYRDGRLSRAMSAELRDVPRALSASYDTDQGRHTLEVTSGGGRAGSAELVCFDRDAAETVLRAELAGLPAKVRLETDPAARRVTETSASAIGRLAVVLQRGGGAVSSPRGGHVTMIKNGAALGVSALLTGVSGLDVTYGATPRASLKGAPGRSFVAAASLDGTRLARMELSNTPGDVDVTLAPAARKAVYRGTGVIREARVAYTDLKQGPTLDATVFGMRGEVAASWTLGERSEVEVTGSSLLPRVLLYAARGPAAPGTSGADASKGAAAPASGAVSDGGKGDDVRAEISGAGRRVRLVADTADRTLTWTSDRPVASVAALARAQVDGRYVRASARVTGVPAGFDASWAPGAYRFRGLSGPVGSAELAFANHDGVRVPTGPHLAAHYDEATGDLDASVRVTGLRSVDFTPEEAGFTAGLGAARQRLALDADVTRGDLRFGLLGHVGPLPGRLSVTSANGVITYTGGPADSRDNTGGAETGTGTGAGKATGTGTGTGTRTGKGARTKEGAGAGLDLRARAWAGKAGALRGMAAAPAVSGGVSLVDGRCDPGTPGCQEGAFCVAGRGCFGVQAYVDLNGLPDRVTLDPARRAVTFDGFRPRGGGLDVYLASSVLAPVPVQARATLTGLPRTVTSMAIGPFEVGGHGVVRAAYRVRPAVTLGSLTVHAEAGGVRGRLAVDPVPAALDVQGTYGARTRVRVTDSAPVRRLSAAVTVPGAGSGELELGDVPAVFGLDTDASGGALRVPALTYKAVPAPGGGTGQDAVGKTGRAAGKELNGLDGRLAVEGGLVDPSGRLGGVALSVTDLAADTTIRPGPGGQGADLMSRPVPTGRLAVRAGLTIDPVARQRLAVAKDVPYTTGFLSYRVSGEFGLERSAVEDVSIAARRVSWLRVRPGRVPFGLKAPAAAGYLAPGFEGAYDRLDIAAKGVDLRPDVRLDVRLSRKVGADVFHDSVRLGRATSLALRRYDQRMRRIGARQSISAAGVRLACLTVDARPGFAAGREGDSITLRGADGPQMVSLLDPGGQVPDYAVDLLTHFMSPFPDAGWKVSGVKAGHCAAPSTRPDTR